MVTLYYTTLRRLSQAHFPRKLCRKVREQSVSRKKMPKIPTFPAENGALAAKRLDKRGKCAYHEGVKSGKYPREHVYTLTYAKKAVNEAQKNYELAKKLWGEDL